MKKHCIYCGKEIILDWFTFIYGEIDKGKKIVEVECPYCKRIEVLK